LAFLVILSLPSTAGTAYAEGFPGKGDEDAWSDALPYYNRGNRYLQKEQYQQALEDFKVAVGKYTFDPDFYTNLGVAYRKVGDYTNAEDAYKKSLQLNDKDWMPWNDLANVYLKQDKLKETVTTFQRALKCNPPAKDKAAIQQDIIDINKILKMQAPPPKVANTSTTPNAGGAAGSTAAKKVSAKPQSQSTATSKPADKKELKGSGWDYVYDGKN
ncbi:MAG: tetratricopeptide repeat protein, partial [Candidatus Melainabacteria bacterium]|nr:tetratricopeptide repeat protein [Candidatus Melainabacteria bacterium]